MAELVVLRRAVDSESHPASAVMTISRISQERATSRARSRRVEHTKLLSRWMEWSIASFPGNTKPGRLYAAVRNNGVPVWLRCDQD